MKRKEIDKIEKKLELTLPAAYVDTLLSEDESDFVDDTSLIRDENLIIELTIEYRKGFEGLPPWPHRYVYIGDEADASPYILDSENEIVLKLDKGNIDRKPIDEFHSFDEFFDSFSDNFEVEALNEKLSVLQWFLYHPTIMALTLIFVVLPLIGMFLKWLVTSIL